MHTHNAIDEHLVLGARTGHGVFEVDGVAHGPVGATPDHLHERVLHVAGKVGLDDLFERAAVAVFVGLGDGADLAVGAVGEDGADLEGVGADFGFGGAVDFGDVRVDGLGVDGGGVFLSAGGEDHEEHAFGLHGEVVFDVLFQGATVGALVGLLDGVHVGV